MKKLIAILLLCCVVAVGSHAQLSIGVQGALSVANFHEQFNSNMGYGSDISPKPRTTYKAGVTLQYMFSPSWGIQSGVNLKEAGTDKSQGVISLEDQIANAVTCRVALRYAELPLTAVYKYALNPNVRIGVRVGGYAAYGYGGQGTLDMGVNGATDISDVFKEYKTANYTFEAASRWDFGLTGGLLLDVYNFTLSANYDRGLSNVYNHYPIMPSYAVKNNAFWIGLGYQFTLRK